VRVRKKNASPIRFVYRHWISFAVVLVAIVAAISLLNWHNNTTNQLIERIGVATDKMHKEADAQIAINQKLLAEAKIAREKAANEAADAARTADESTVATIDSSACNLVI